MAELVEYKVVETSSVTDEVLEKIINETVAQGWSLRRHAVRHARLVQAPVDGVPDLHARERRSRWRLAPRAWLARAPPSRSPAARPTPAPLAFEPHLGWDASDDADWATAPRARRRAVRGRAAGRAARRLASGAALPRARGRARRRRAHRRRRLRPSGGGRRARRARRDPGARERVPERARRRLRSARPRGVAGGRAAARAHGGDRGVRRPPVAQLRGEPAADRLRDRELGSRAGPRVAAHRAVRARRARVRGARLDAPRRRQRRCAGGSARGAGARRREARAAPRRAAARRAPAAAAGARGAGARRLRARRRAQRAARARDQRDLRARSGHRPGRLARDLERPAARCEPRRSCSRPRPG